MFTSILCFTIANFMGLQLLNITVLAIKLTIFRLNPYGHCPSVLKVEEVLNKWPW